MEYSCESPDQLDLRETCLSLRDVRAPVRGGTKEAAATQGVETASWEAHTGGMYTLPGTNPAVMKNGRKRRGKEKKGKRRKEAREERKGEAGRSGRKTWRKVGPTKCPHCAGAVPGQCDEALRGLLSLPGGDRHTSRPQGTAALPCFLKDFNLDFLGPSLLGAVSGQRCFSSFLGDEGDGDGGRGKG